MSGNTSSDIWIAGAFAAFSVDLLVYPLDTLKTRMQSPDYKKLFLHQGTNTVNRAALFRGLYQGLGSVIIATLPSSGAFFTTYEGVKSLGNSINSNGSIPAFIVHSTASGAAELVACAILTPAEVIKQNAQMVSSRDTTNSSATRQTLRKFRANPLGLWRGYGALAGRNLPFTAIHFPIFEHFKEGLKDWRRSSVGERRLEQISLLEHAGITSLAAGVAGSIAAVVTTPVDVVKTRIMLAAATGNAEQNVRASGQQATERVKDGKIVDALGKIAGVARASPKGPGSSWRIAREIVQTQGWRGLMRGGGLRAAWTMLGSGLYLGVYDSGRVYLERARKDS